MMIRTLLADDHTIVREGLRLLLEGQPDIVVVGEAANGREAVQQARLLHPDVVLMDIGMPELNGIEATHQLHERYPAIHIVILSMHSNEEYVRRAFRAGASGYVLKESVGTEVIAAVRTTYVGQRYLSRQIAEVKTSLTDEDTLDPLSEREREVLQLIVEGKTSAQIAAILALSTKTIETYRSRLMQKLAINDLPSLVKFAIQHGLTPLE